MSSRAFTLTTLAFVAVGLLTSVLVAIAAATLTGGAPPADPAQSAALPASGAQGSELALLASILVLVSAVVALVVKLLARPTAAGR